MRSSHDRPTAEIPPLTEAMRAEALVLAMSIRNQELREFTGGARHLLPDPIGSA